MKTHPTVLVTENIGYLPSEDTGTLGDMLPPCLSACLQALLVIRLTMPRPFDRKSIGYETPQHRSFWDFSLSLETPPSPQTLHSGYPDNSASAPSQANPSS